MKHFVPVLLLLCLPAQLFSGAVLIIQPEFASLMDKEVALIKIATGLQFTEGPVWVEQKGSAGGYLLFSDIPADRIYRWAEGDTLSVWRSPSGQSNGLILDRSGRLIACEHGNRRVSITLGTDSVAALCQTYMGKKLNSPNDAAIGQDGSIWFTDPPYGLSGRKQEQPANYVFHLAPGAQEPKAVISDFDMPNGIVLSPDKNLAYIADSGKPHHVRSFRVKGDTLNEIGIFAVISPGGPDGMCVDAEGRLYVTAGDGVHVFSPEGALLGKILTPQTPANCCFGGEDWRTLFITARPDVYSIRLKVKGLL
ncbi:MAG TPA: SMP-30/gluconolactonase/LRE family protein [archaeon]|nr:SMP-30/gluconolactonase/LRE family protein [archaeon]